VMYELKRMNSPATRSLRQLEPARIFPACSGVVQPRRRRTKSSCSYRWKRQEWLRGDMVEIATDARARIVRKQEGKKAPGEKSKLKKCEEKTKGCCSVWRRQVRKGSQSLRHMPLNKAVPPLNSTATEGNPKSRSHQVPASYPL
jgi:hypothetical protein